MPNQITIDGVDYIPATSAQASYDGDLPAVVFIRTVTMHYVGRILDISDSYIVPSISSSVAFIVLEDASWVADSGRFGEALANGTLIETERFPDPVWISTGAIVDITVWNYPLPTVSQ